MAHTNEFLFAKLSVYFYRDQKPIFLSFMFAIVVITIDMPYNYLSINHFIFFCYLPLEPTNWNM